MKDPELSGPAGRVRQELEELKRILERINEGWSRARCAQDDYYIDGVALNLHGLYSGFERTLTRSSKPSMTIFHKGRTGTSSCWHK